jgi:hypothetical protein
MTVSARRRRWQRLPLWRRRRLLERLRARKVQRPEGPQREHFSLAFWRGMGVWITRISDFPAEWLPTYAAGYSFVVVPTLYGTELDPGIVSPADLQTWVGKARAAGIEVAGSQWGLGDYPAAEAQAAYLQVLEHDFDGWVMNGEKKYEGGSKSAEYANAFRNVQADLPLAWSPEPRLSLDHNVLQAKGVAYMPQAYPLENGWNVDAVAQVGLDFGYRSENIIPLIQAYPDGAGTRWPAGDYAKRARDANLPGLVLYAGNQAADVPNYWKELIL